MRANGGRQIHLLDKGRVMAEYGPMQLVISASIGEVPQVEECVRAAKESFQHLECVARCKDSISVPWHHISGPVRDEVPLSMVSASRAVGDKDLTPMAAVAGAIADAVADFLFDRGMTKVVVSNGGDVAIRLTQEHSARIGIGALDSSKGYPFDIVLDGSRLAWGVATSGLGGRSLTKGIASHVTVVSTMAAYADAAATAVANATFVEDSEVKQSLAEDMDANTDIRGSMVVTKVGRISEEKIALGLSRGRERAENLLARGIILGALIIIKDRVDLVGSLGGVGTN